jgi:Ca2+-transporting ATPase
MPASSERKERLTAQTTMQHHHHDRKIGLQSIPKPWSLSVDQVLERLDVEATRGLSDQEAGARLNIYGPNHLQTRPGRAWPSVLIAQFKSFLVLLLALAAVLGFIFQNWIEGCAICVVILINAAIGFFTEIGAIRSMESLRKFNAVHVTVRRDGKSKRLRAEKMVPGDIVTVEAGDVIAADMRLISASRLLANESLLTGESFPVEKSLSTLPQETIAPERFNMLYKGASINRGSAEAVVTGTGLDTELGRISSLVLATKDEITPLEKRLNLLARKLIIVTLIVTLLTLIMGLISGKELLLMIETSIALAVAAIPEGLPIIATLALARGMWRMAKNNALINRLSAVETLGATHVICTDKTGTLTENKMTLDRIHPTASGGDMEILKIGALCNKATSDGIGDPLEVALLHAAKERDFIQKDLSETHPLVSEEAFDSESKRMATAHRHELDILVAVKGAAEAILSICTRIRTSDASIPLTDMERSIWLRKNHDLASAGFRVLAFATKSTTGLEEPLCRDLTFLGLASFIDPPREDVRAALEECRKAGIRVVMVTGDQPGTAVHVAKSVHILNEGAPDGVVLGKNLPMLSDQQLLEAGIFARVTPGDKLRIIALHQKNGSVVAMTGDGINDAPALKKADIGIAMGLRGTEVSREAADMILRDDSFTTIVTAIRQGRIIYNNIRKFVVYLMSCNLSEVLIVGLAAWVDAPLPLLPLQILFLNMITDVFPALALGASEGDQNVMSHPPRKMAVQLIGRSQWIRITGYSLLITVVVLGAFFYSLDVLQVSSKEAVTSSFLVLAIAQILHVFNMTEKGSPFFLNEITRNHFIWLAISICFALLFAALYVPVLSAALDLTIPCARSWLLIVLGGSAPLVIGRLASWISSQSMHSVEH